MSVVSDFESFETASVGAVTPITKDGYQIDDTYWGYVVRTIEPPSLTLSVFQGLSWLAGIGFVVATAGLWLMPSSMTGPDVLGMKIGATAVALALSVFCLWFASRGTDSEIQIDTRMGEVREVVRNRTGRSTLVGRYGFDAIGSVFIDAGPNADRRTMETGSLVLRYRNTAQTMHVATGTTARLALLRDRIGRDLMLAGTDARPDVPAPEFAMRAA